MAINLKAKETLQQIGEYKGKYRYVLGTEIYNRLSDAKVIIQAAAIPRRLAAHRAAMFRGLNISHSTFI